MRISRRKLRRALRLALYKKEQEGGDGFDARAQSVRQFLRNSKGLDLLAADIEDDIAGGYTGPLGDGIQDLFQWFLDNWEQILEMIMSIINLFSVI